MQLNLDRYVPALLTFISNKLSVSATKVYKEQFGVSVTEWRILSLLKVEPNINSQRIIECLGYDKAAVSRTLKALENKALINISDDPNDLRSYCINLTDNGHELHDQIILVALEREQTLLSDLNSMEIENLIYLLNKVHKNVGKL